MAEKVEAKGGKGGREWNDTADNENIAKIEVGGGPQGIKFIKIDYVKNGQVQNGSVHGVFSKGFTDTFDINYLKNEYLESVEGYYNETTGVIQGFIFKTNLNTSDLMGSDVGTKFSLAVLGKRVIGFHGFAETNINSIGAYFIKVPPYKSPLRGAILEANWDDGGDFDGVKSVSFSTNSQNHYFYHITFEYAKGGQVVTKEHTGSSKKDVEKKFTVDYPNDYITCIEATVGRHSDNDFIGITSLTFITAKGIVSQLFGIPVGRIYRLENKGHPIVGFHGRVGVILDNLGVYCGDSNLAARAQKLEAKGGKGGQEWDDSADHDDVIKAEVRVGMYGIQFIKFSYVKDGQVQNGSIHGVSSRGFTHTFDINYLNNEYLESVEGYYDEATGVIQGIIFKTNQKTSDLIGSDVGTKFSLATPHKKIIGFHGFAEKNLNSLGAYFSKPTPVRVPYEGADYKAGWDNGGNYENWDDGGDYDGVKNLYVSHDPNNYFYHIAFDYDKGGKVETKEHRWISPKGSIQNKFAVDYPNDYITSIEGTIGQHGGNNYLGVTSLSLKTAKGITSPTYGYPMGRKFVIESKDKAVVGFHGKIGVILDNIGVYYGSPPLRAPSEKLQARGGDGGTPWDDGAFDGVRKIYVGQGDNGIGAVKFVYDKDSQMVEGSERGMQTRLGYDTFDIGYPSEYITAVEGYFDKIFGSQSGVLTMLKFKTNKGESPTFGIDSGSRFVIEKTGYKIVGFHGNASQEIHQLGVHVVPITQ